MLGAEEGDEVDDESTCLQINLFKSDSDEIDIISELNLLPTKIYSFLNQTLSQLQAFARALTNLRNLCTCLAKNSLRKTLFSTRSGRSGKMVTTEMFSFRIISLT